MSYKRILLLVISCGVMLLNLLGCGGESSNSAAPPTPIAHNEWTWVSGANAINRPGTYGTQGTAAAANTPGARYGAVTWTDASGDLWLFGGITAPTSTSDTYFNDLWKFSKGQWIWVKGSNTDNQPGVYGTLGLPGPNNNPGGRSNAVSWIDSSGNLWLFGGAGMDANGWSEDLNDLWKYSNGQWTWMGGPQTTIVGTPGIYGTKGIAAVGNIPGGRTEAMAWTDASGNLWLFGGLGEDSVGDWGFLNDLWKYGNGQWTWVSGANIVQQASVYGTIGITATGNTPGGRADAATWVDGSGEFWLFGGSDYRSMSPAGATSHLLNDLWKFNNGQWTWMGGSDQLDQPGVYGSKGTASPTNIPGARAGATAWTDGSGNFWLFGGYSPTWPNDLWKYSNGQWTWVSGSQSNSGGTYGTLGNTSSASSPGSRSFAAGWIDRSGRLWLFGGEGNDTSNQSWGYLNDLWMYEP